jgi:hypothetical protein
VASRRVKPHAAFQFSNLMTDPLRSDRPPTGADVPERERDARVEDLLLSGLDHYFAGHYDLAISVWTRVLFLNHGHARARAYIERARSAISEQQREGEELLHSGVDAFVRGDGAAARRLLTSAVERGASSEEALAVLERLNRLEAANGPHDAGVFPGQMRSGVNLDSDAIPVRADHSRAKWIAVGVAAGVAVAATAAWLWARGADWLQLDGTSPAPTAVRVPDEPLPVPAASEVSIARARSLYSRGHLHEALTALEGVRHGDALWDEADTLRATIQRELLASSAADGRADRRQVSRQ